MPIVDLGLPVETSEAPEALRGLRDLLGWSSDPNTCRIEANELLSRLLQRFPDDQLASAARQLFGIQRGSSPEVQTRRQAAASRLGVSAGEFAVDIEPYLLRILAWQIIQDRWPRRPNQSDRPNRHILTKSAYVFMLLFLIAASTTGLVAGHYGSSVEALERASALGLAIFTACLTIFIGLKFRKTDLPSRRYGQLSPDLDDSFLSSCQEEAASRLDQSGAAILLMVEMLLSPSRYRMRTIESISLDGRCIKQRVTQEFTFGDALAFLRESALNQRQVLAPNPKKAIAAVGLADTGIPREQAEEGPTAVSASHARVIEVEVEFDESGEPPVSADSSDIDRIRTAPPLFYVPILVPAKGDLVDQLEIQRSDGSAAHSVSHTQTLRLVALGLRFLLLAALAEPGTNAAAFDDKDFREHELVLLRLISRRGPLGRSGGPWEAGLTASTGASQSALEHRKATALLHLTKVVEATLEALERQFPWKSSDDAKRIERVKAFSNVRDYVLKLAQCYPILVSLPNNDQAYRRLAYERVIAPAPFGTHRLRLWAGLRPDRVVVPVTLPFEADSYHLEIIGPAEYYLREQLLGCPRCSARVDSTWRGLSASGSGCHHGPIGGDERCYVRVRRRAGQNYCHVYLRGFAASKLDEHGQQIIMTARFAEAPPGIEERALLAAAAASVVVAVIGYLRSRNGLLPPTDIADIPALLLAVPGVAATWFGFNSDTDTVLRSSLTARISLLATGLLSVAAVSCYLLQAYLGWKRGPQWGFLGVHEWVWLVLLGVSVANTGIIAYKAAARMLHFVWLSSRPIAQADQPATTGAANGS